LGDQINTKLREGRRDMGITILTAMIIQTRGDDVKSLAGGPSAEGKYANYIYLFKEDGRPDHLMLSTKPYFNTSKEAVEFGNRTINNIRNSD
jgi:hypothetical protein